MTDAVATGRLDLGGLRSAIAFCLDVGAHGIVAPVAALVAWTLMDEERRTIAEVLVEGVADRVVVVVGVLAGSVEASVAFARHASMIGADAVIALPPSGLLTALGTAFTDFQNVSQAITIPIFARNRDPQFGTRLPAASVARLVRELEYVAWIVDQAGDDAARARDPGRDRARRGRAPRRHGLHCQTVPAG